MKGMKRIIAVAMAVSLAFATTAFAAATPVPDFNKVVGTNIYGTYECYNWAEDYVNRAEVGFYTDDGSDYISVGNVAIGGNHYYRGYTGILTHVMGNVYVSSNPDEGLTLLVVFGDDGGMSITITEDNREYGDSELLNGVYDQVSQLDLAHVG